MPLHNPPVIAGITGLTAALAAKLDAAAGVVTDSTLTVKKSDESAAIRLRSSGGAVDFDKYAGDIVVSSFAGPGFGGTQTALQRWKGDGTTLAGNIEFGSSVYLGEQAIDTANGVALLGAKNSLSNLRFCGRKGTAGAPVTGTWVAADLIIDSIGAWHLCLVGGTPGTWT